MIHLYTGEGKGKTTAAIGLCIRAAGRGHCVCFSQFMKGNDTGELYVLESLPNVEILRSGKNYGFYASMSEADKEEALPKSITAFWTAFWKKRGAEHVEWLLWMN